MGVNFHLLTKGATSNKALDKGGHTWPPVVLAEKGISTEEPPMARGKGGVDQGDEVLTSVWGNIKMIFEIRMRIRKTPIGNGGKG